jgi:hypothetical protein
MDHEKPLPGVHVQLQYWKVGNSSNKTFYKDVNADANGEFAIPIDFHQSYLYQLNVNLTDHFGVEGYRVYRNLYGLIQLYPFAYTKLRIIKTGNNDSKISINSEDFVFFSSKTSAYDTTLPNLNRVKAGQELKIKWTVTDNALPSGPQNPNVLLGSFTVSPGQTFVYTIRYD